MTFPDLSEELLIATEAARAAGDEVLRMRRDGLRYGRKDGWELVSEADIRASEMLHDALAKLTAQHHRDGQIERFPYVPRGLLVWSIDGRGHETARRYDAVGNLVRLVDPAQNVTTYA